MDAAVQEAKDQAELNELLIWAAARGLLADAVELISRGAEPTFRDKKGLCSVHYAAAHGHLDVLQYLATKGADLEAEDSQARVPLHYAAVGRSVEVLRFLIKHSTWLNAADAADDTALHLAAKTGWAHGLQLLLAASPAVDVPNKRCLSALGEAVAGGHVAAAEMLIKSGADVRWRASGYTLLHVAAGLGQAKTLGLLLNQGAAADMVNDRSNSDSATPLHAAAMAGSLACAKLLLEHKADAAASGAGNLQAWEVIPQSSEAEAKQLHALLQQAAGFKPGVQSKSARIMRNISDASHTVSTKATSTAQKRHASAPVKAGDTPADPVAAYSAQFALLNATEQGRKVETFARMSEAELSQLDFLSHVALQCIKQVRRAHQLLTCYRAVAALRSDEQFQEDASEPAVRAALQEMALQNNLEKYRDDRQVMSVAAKLKKFHAVMQECGNMRLGLQDILIKPGETLSQLMEQDARQVKGLTAAAAAARAKAVAVISGLPATTPEQEIDQRGPTAQGTNNESLSRPVAVVSSEIEVDESPQADAAGILDLDAQLQQHKQQRTAASKNPEEMESWERMRYKFVNSLKQAVKIMAYVCLIWGLMWWLGILPGQQDVAGIEQRLLMAVQQKEQELQQTAADTANTPKNEL